MWLCTDINIEFLNPVMPFEFCLHDQNFSFVLFSPGAISDDTDSSQAIYTEFDDDFEEEEVAAPIGQCTALYNFPGMVIQFCVSICEYHTHLFSSETPPSVHRLQ